MPNNTPSADPHLSHLVVASLPGKAWVTKVRLLKRLITALGTKAAYTIEAINEGDGKALQCAFEKKDDADRLSTALNARVIGQFPGWASQRAMMLDVSSESRVNKTIEDLKGA